MFKPEIETALNEQLTQEFAAAYTYLQMAAFCEDQNLDGFARWMMGQHLEEQAHAMRLYRYVLDRGGRPVLGGIDAPEAKYDSILSVFQAAKSHEAANTASINQLYVLAKEHDDFATISHLQWFVDEQVEEEKVFDEAISLIKMAGSDPSALLMLNEKLGQRVPGAEVDGGAA